MKRPLTLEFLEDQSDRGLDLLVGVDLEGTRRAPDITDRRQAVEFAASRLVPLALIHSIFENMKFRFAHDSGEPKQKPVVVVGRVIEPVGVGQERAKAST